MQVIPLSEVAKHNKDGDAWTVVHGKVLDISEFLPRHPGGKAVLKQYAGKVRSTSSQSCIGSQHYTPTPCAFGCMRYSPHAVCSGGRDHGVHRTTGPKFLLLLCRCICCSVLSSRKTQTPSLTAEFRGAVAWVSEEA